jgi:hypothetical protein
LNAIVIDIYYYKVRSDKAILPGMLSSLGGNWGSIGGDFELKSRSHKEVKKLVNTTETPVNKGVRG